MAVFKCKMCGGELTVSEGQTVCECEYCGTSQTLPSADDEKKSNLYSRAEKLRLNNEFDSAAGVYESIVSEFPEEAEAYWGLCLCKYGVEQVYDPAASRKIITCHRTCYDSISDDENFRLACEHADGISRRSYQEDAAEIDRLQKGILDIVKNEQPYDIFICYKETDENGRRTKDSVLAQDMYDALTDKGYKVFFSRITLEDKLGRDYEPYIFAALTSAKIMLAVGTNHEYYKAAWVKNEWSRFLDMMKSDKSKTLIPCYADIDAYSMPREFRNLQGQDMGKVGFLQDIVRGVGKILPREQESKHAPVVQQVVSGGATVDSLLERAFMYLEDKDWTNADSYCEKVLDIEPKNARAYLGKFLVGMRITDINVLENVCSPFDTNPNYSKIMTYGDEALKKQLSEYNENARVRYEQQQRINLENQKESQYQNARLIMETAQKVSDCQKASKLFETLGDYKDSKELMRICAEKEIKCSELEKFTAYQNGKKLMDNLEFRKAAKIFEKFGDYMDSASLAQICREKELT